MMDFIMVPAIIGIITLGVYKLFELFVRRRERLNIIEKIGDQLDPSILGAGHPIPVKIFNQFSSGALKAGCLLVGIGVGLLVGYFLSKASLPEGALFSGSSIKEENAGIIMGASLLLFGGIGLLVAFFIEMKYSKKQ